VKVSSKSIRNETRRLSPRSDLLASTSLWITTKKVRLNLIHLAKEVGKIQQKENAFGVKKSPLTEFLKEIDRSKEFPKSFGMIDAKNCNGDEINLKSFYMGKRYAHAFSKGKIIYYMVRNQG